MTPFEIEISGDELFSFACIHSFISSGIAESIRDNSGDGDNGERCTDDTDAIDARERRLECLLDETLRSV
jgi:hypothetical protein